MAKAEVRRRHGSAIPRRAQSDARNLKAALLLCVICGHARPSKAKPAGCPECGSADIGVQMGLEDGPFDG